MSCVVEYESKSCEKANDYAVDALKQLITLAAGILALNITFIKDFIGTSRPLAVCSFLVPVGWICLLLAIWFAWVAIADAARMLGTGQVSGYAFKKPLSTRLWAKIAQTLFMLGLAALGTFAVANFVF